ncbi:RNA-binding protein 7 [Denticeps clupeoides]|uniref:RRM domain-containing protein n=1 Tax=Denticeps clupeoides TaxID=299321 RepID=A0AAY4E5A8_9TELE|nr:RNA-binding protein 7 [Denticeps clupeoides]
MGIADEADRTLFVGNLDFKVTEELLFELFLQAGPLIKVKIPKDADGKSKLFGFVNFKHEVSVPYGMSLLNGTRLFGRPLKIQFRAGSSHVSQEGNSPGNAHNISPAHTPTYRGGRYDRGDQMGSPPFPNPPNHMRPGSSPETLQRQAVMNNMWQMTFQQMNGSFQTPQQHQSIPSRAGRAGGEGSPWQQDTSSQRGYRHHDGMGHHGRDQRYNGGGPERHRRDHSQRSDFYHHDNRSRDYPERRRDGSRDGRWKRC